MRREKVSEPGILTAAGLALIGTIGHFATCSAPATHDGEWLFVFVLAFITLCASAVNFDLKRWLD